MNGYLLPIRRSTGEPLDQELAAYLRRLAMSLDEVVVVDGSDPAEFTEHRRVWGPSVRHIAPDPALACLNGKVHGVLTGLFDTTADRLVIADDDVRYDDRTLDAVLAALDTADLVIPQNVFEPMPWHAAWDTSRSLINRCFSVDSPGTLAVRTAALLQIGGYDGDVMYENLELVRTMRAAGSTVVTRPDVVVARRPPTARRFFEQRHRQAYDDFAHPFKPWLFLTVIPLLSVLAVRNPRRFLRTLWATVTGSWLMAEYGRRRHGGAGAISGAARWWAPVWILERSVAIWWALGERLTGGVRYRGGRIPVAAHTGRQLAERHRPKRSAVAVQSSTR